MSGISASVIHMFRCHTRDSQLKIQSIEMEINHSMEINSEITLVPISKSSTFSQLQFSELTENLLTFLKNIYNFPSSCAL